MNKEELLKAIIYNKEQQSKFNEEIQILSNRMSASKLEQQELEQRLIKKMQEDGIVKENADVGESNVSVSWYETPPKVVIHNKDAVPEEFITKKQYTQKTVNKSRIKKYLMQGNKCNFASVSSEARLKIQENI